MSRSKPELLKDWLGLLRSGQYEQAREVLKSEEGKYCCLGVAAEGLFHVEWELDGNEWHIYCDDSGNCAYDNVLATDHAIAMGLNEEIDSDERAVLDGIVKYIIQDWEEESKDIVEYALRTEISPGTSRETYLVHLNDSGFTFENIATFIELSGWIADAEREQTIIELSALGQEIESE